MAAAEIRVTLPDGSEKRLPAGATGADLAKAIGPGLAKAALAVRVDGQVRDLARPLPDGAKVAILTDKDPQALDVLRHSSAHVLATAVRQLFPRAKIGFGPPIEDGFYYDFEVPAPFTPEDLAQIEAKMREVTAADYPFVREEVDRAAAKLRFADDPLKLERIDDLGPDEVISIYTDGPFVDLCRGPHVPSTGRIKHFKLLHAAGAYWRGDERRQMLQRVYGTAWFSKDDLEAYLRRLDEAKKRDHRVLGKQLDLFSIQEEIFQLLDMVELVLGKTFGLSYRLDLATRPDKKLGTDATWDQAERALEQALKHRGATYRIDQGGGAFYGPKIDIKFNDAIGREGQGATIQLDFEQPERFGLEYTGEDNRPHRPVMIHRAIYGTLERFCGFLIEHFAGAFPLWLAPEQVRVLPISDAQIPAARAVQQA